MRLGRKFSNALRKLSSSPASGKGKGEETRTGIEGVQQQPQVNRTDGENPQTGVNTNTDHGTVAGQVSLETPANGVESTINDCEIAAQCPPLRQSLWRRAYEALEVEHTEMVHKYEELLALEINKHGMSDPRAEPAGFFLSFFFSLEPKAESNTQGIKARSWSGRKMALCLQNYSNKPIQK
jgi:hypothetical protein